MTELKWREMSNEDRDEAYSPSSCLPNGDYRPFVEAYKERSESSWSQLKGLGATTSTVTYGNDQTQTIDVAIPPVPETGPAEAPPLLVYFHGGYWQELSKVDSRFAAADSVNRGWAFAAVDYTLAPDATLTTIVDQCRTAVRALQERSEALGYDPARIFVSGSSAGAHLAAMTCIDPDRGTPPILGAILVSGIFELEPLIGTSINDALGLDHTSATANSPLGMDLTAFPSTVVAYGSNETTEFKAQSTAMAKQLSNAGTTTAALEIAGRNHFDVILDLATPGTTLGDAVAHLIEPNGESAAAEH